MMKQRLVMAAGLTLSFFGGLAAQSDADRIAEARRRVVLPPIMIRLETESVRVPLVGTKTLPLVNTKINGKGPYRLLVDTAANVMLLQMRVADELQLPVLRPGESSKLVAVKMLKIGGAHFEDMVVGARRWNEDIDGVMALTCLPIFS